MILRRTFHHYPAYFLHMLVDLPSLGQMCTGSVEQESLLDSDRKFAIIIPIGQLSSQPCNNEQPARLTMPSQTSCPMPTSTEAVEQSA